MTLNEYEMKKFKDCRKLAVIISEKGKRLFCDDMQPGWGGFGLNRASDNITVDGKPARFTDNRRSSSVGCREFVFI